MLPTVDLLGNLTASVYARAVMFIYRSAAALHSQPRLSGLPRRRSQAARFAACALVIAVAAVVLAAPARCRAAAPAAGTPATQHPPAKKQPPTAAERTKSRAVHKRATALIRQIRTAAPGTARYGLVDQLIDLGDDAWISVKPAIPGFLKLAEGEAVGVDVMLGFMDQSYDSIEKYVARLSPPAARRVVKFILRLDADKRQIRVLKQLVTSKDAALLLLVLPALLPHARSRVMARLIEIVDDTRLSLSAWAIDTLAANRHAPALPSLVRLLGIEQRRASGGNLDRRRKLIAAIARIGGEPSVPPLLEALAMADQRVAVYEGMRVVGGPAVLAALFMLRTSSGDRIAIAMDLLDYMRFEAAPHLVALLSNANRSTRDLATDVLSRIATPDVRPQLIRMVREKRFADLRDGVRILMILYNYQVRALLFELIEHKDPEIRLFIVKQLWHLRDPHTFRVLRVVAAQDKDRAVRLAAVAAVAGVQDPLGPALLRRMAAETDPNVRHEVIEQLSRVGDWRHAVPALASLLADPNDGIFLSTLSALQRMTFQRVRRRPAQWRAWLQAAKARAIAAHERLQPDETAFSAGSWQFAAQRAGTAGPTLLVVSGPPYRDATHLAPQVWRLASRYRVVVLRRAPGDYLAARATQRSWSNEVNALAKAAGVGNYVLFTDAAGSAYALRHCAANKAVRAVIVDGGWLPSRSALRQLPAQMRTAMGKLGMADWQWAIKSQWRVVRGLRLRIALRAVLRGLLGVRAVGLWINRRNVLAVDALRPTLWHRVRGVIAGLRWPKIRRPVLLLLGAKAPWAADVPEQMKALPKGHRVQVVTIPGAGALPLLERPDATISAINTFLSR